MPVSVQRGDETITVSTTAIGLTAAELVEAVHSAIIYVESGANIRFNATQDPTAAGTEGSPLVYVGGRIYVSGGRDLASVKFISATGADAVIRVLYFGDGRS